jgi:hypothetical protein
MACESLGLNPCVGVILRTLSTPVLDAVQAALQTLVAAVQVQIAALEAQLLQLDVLGVPLEAVQGLAQKALDEAERATSFIPFDLVTQTGCVDLSNLAFLNGRFVSERLADAREIVDGLGHLNFVRLLIEGGITELSDLADQANRIIDCIDEVVLL